MGATKSQPMWMDEPRTRELPKKSKGIKLWLSSKFKPIENPTQVIQPKIKQL
jgi:hypothetical protein